MTTSLPIHNPSCEVLQRIEGTYYTDYLVRGFPGAADVAELAEGKAHQVYGSLWRGLWIVRMLTGER